MTDSLALVQQQIQKNEIASVYVYSGQELWAKKRTTRALKKALVPEGMESFNFDHFYATDQQAVAVVDCCLTLSMMADRKLIYVEDCQKWDTKQRKVILEYMKSPCLDACLILDFDVEKTGKFGGFFRFKGKDTHFLEFKKPAPWELESYIGKLAESCGVVLDKNSTAILAEYTGDDIELMRRELEKLKLYKWGEDRIEVEDVEALTGRTRHVNRWELQKKIAGRDTAECLTKLQNILDSGETPIGLLSVLSRYIGQLLQVKALAANGIRDKYQLAREIHLPANIAGALLDEHPTFSAVELRNALKMSFESDDLLKGSRLRGGSVVSRLVASLLYQGVWSP